MIKDFIKPHFMKLSDNKKNELTKGLSFGSSAILIVKTRNFPSPSHGGFGFVRRLLNYPLNLNLSLLQVPVY